MTDVITDLGDVTTIYAPKRSCPHDKGFWYCDECWDRHFEEVSELDCYIPMRGCGGVEDDKVCGKTHLGYEWCEMCQAAGMRKPNPHIGEFEIVGRIRG